MQLVHTLHNEPVSRLDISNYCTVPVTASVSDAMTEMRNSRCSCALIIDQSRLVGIFTDRDVLRKVVDRPETWSQPVSQFMTSTPQTIGEEAVTAQALELMDEGRFRNVPVVNDSGQVVGNINHFAILKLLADSFPSDVYNRPPDSSQFARRRHGA